MSKKRLIYDVESKYDDLFGSAKTGGPESPGLPSNHITIYHQLDDFRLKPFVSGFGLHKLERFTEVSKR